MFCAHVELNDYYLFQTNEVPRVKHKSIETHQKKESYEHCFYSGESFVLPVNTIKTVLQNFHLFVMHLFNIVVEVAYKYRSININL